MNIEINFLYAIIPCLDGFSRVPWIYLLDFFYSITDECYLPGDKCNRGCNEW